MGSLSLPPRNLARAWDSASTWCETSSSAWAASSTWRTGNPAEPRSPCISHGCPRDSDPLPEPAGDRPSLLIVDDDEAFRTALGAALERKGFSVSLAHDATSAEQAARTRVFECALVDVRMPGASGIELCATLQSIDEGTTIVVLTGFGTIANAVAAMRAGAADYLTKPVDVAACQRALLNLGPIPSDGASDDSDVPSLNRVEYEYLQRVLTDCQGNISEAARRLRLHRQSLQRKLSRTPPSR